MNVFQEMTPVIFILTGIVSSGCGLFLSLELALTILPWAAALLQGRALWTSTGGAVGSRWFLLPCLRVSPPSLPWSG